MQHASTLMTFPMEKCPHPIHKTKNPTNPVTYFKDKIVGVVKFCKLQKTFQLSKFKKAPRSLEIFHLNKRTILNILLYTMHKS